MSPRRPYDPGRHPLADGPMTPEQARKAGLIADPAKLRHADAALAAWQTRHNLNTESGRLAAGKEFAREQVMRGEMVEAPFLPNTVEELPEATDDPPRGSLRHKILHPEEYEESGS